MSRPVALITGASSGIGAELAKVFAAQGYDLVLSARRADRLEDLAQTLRQEHPGLQAFCKPLDLTRRKAPSQLIEYVHDQALVIDVLVNNAGSAHQGYFTELDQSQVQKMSALNMRAVADLTHLVLPDMLIRGSGRILNVASIVGFQAVPGMSLYSASKAFVLSFTESLAEELLGTGVTVCALCPGLTRTELADQLGASDTPGSQWLMADAHSVAVEGYRALMRGETVHVTGCANQMAMAWADAQPRWLKRRLSGFAARMGLRRAQPSDHGEIST